MTSVRRALASVVLASCGLSSALLAQRRQSVDTGSTPCVLGQRIRLLSTALHETREVIVTPPPSYAAGDRRYPVVYVLDGG